MAKTKPKAQPGLRTRQLFWWLQPANDFEQRDDLEFLQMPVTPALYTELMSLTQQFSLASGPRDGGLQLVSQRLSLPVRSGYLECDPLPYLAEQLGAMRAANWMEECREQGVKVWPSELPDPSHEYGVTLESAWLELSLMDGDGGPVAVCCHTVSPEHGLRLRGYRQAWSTLGPLLARTIGLVNSAEAKLLAEKGTW